MYSDYTSSTYEDEFNLCDAIQIRIILSVKIIG